MSQATGSSDIVTNPRLFPDGEMNALLGDEDDPNKRSTALSRARARIENAGEQARKIREQNPEYYEMLHAAICEEDTDERIERLEERVQELEAKLDD